MKKAPTSFAALLALLGAATLGFLVATPPAEVNPPANPAQLSSSASSSAPASFTSHQTSTVASSSIRRILPGLTQAPSDWRTFRPKQITFSPYPDTPLTFTATSIREEHGRTVWIGRNSVDGAFLITVATADTWTAELALPGANMFTAEISGATATLNEIHDTLSTCALCVHPQLAARFAATASLPDFETPLPPPSASATEEVNTVDLLIFYHPQLLNPTGTNASSHRTREAIETQAIAHVAYLNQAVINSAIDNIQWRFVALYETPDTPHSFEGDPDQGATLGKDLRDMATNDNPLGAFVREKTLLHGVDQAVLYVPYAANRSSPFTAGIAYQPGRHAVVSLSSGISAVFAHECAHNLGCGHDRTESEAPDNNAKFNYGHIHGATSSSPGAFRTIMAYGSHPRIPNFSNPSVNHLGNPTGLDSTHPKAADNARRIREQAATFAAFRTSTATPPAITTQPASVSVNTGATFSLSVTATGTSLSYQWRKDDTPIADATNSTYTKTAATTDAGSYTVTVSNLGGQITSTPATVTVTTPPPPPGPTSTSTPTPTPTPAPSSSGGGGGGGGGSPSLIFVSALALLSAARVRLNSRP